MRRKSHLTTDLIALQRTLPRRQLLQWLGGAALLAGCGADMTGGQCVEIPEETEGPYPGDGSNGVNALALSGIVRNDLRTSFGSGSATAGGVPLTIDLTLTNVTDGCSPLAGYAIYLWHCDREGRYSLYSQGVTNENYLRGVQETDSEGRVTFTTIFPGCYAGRWPHAHFEVFPSLASASSHSAKVATSQLALPQTECAAVYATTGYDDSVRNLAGVTLASDGIFRDGYSAQLASLTGNVTDGYVASLMFGITP